jgi:hypothetical protein
MNFYLFIYLFISFGLGYVDWASAIPASGYNCIFYKVSTDFGLQKDLEINRYSKKIVELVDDNY